MKLGKLSNTALGFALLGLSGVAYANPEGPQVQHGQVDVTGLGSSLVQVLQQSPSAIVNWNQFSVGANEMVRFLQPGQHAVILNRVVGQNPSDILGQIQANGSVWLINPNGILFGPGSQINAGSFLASTLNISNEDFLAGRFNFEQMKNPTTGLPQDLRSVVNQGTITVTDGGYAVLMAPTVLNQGLVIANLGKVVMAAGEKATLSFDAGKLINYRVEGMTGEPGTVVIPQQAVSALLSQVIKTDSVVEAGRLIPNADGSVALVHGSGLLVHEGTTRADGATGQQAGSVSLEAAQSLVVGPNSTISASGQGANSDGGSIKLNSGHATATMAGSQLVATQGDSGVGGFIETSSKGAAYLNGRVDTGAGGRWLIDPRFVTIINGAGGGAIGTATVSEQTLEAATGSITIQADDTITVNDLSDNNLTLTSGASVTFQTTTGNFVMADPNDSIVASGSGNLSLQIGQDIFLGHLVSTGTGTVSLQYGGQVFEQGGAPAVRADHIAFNLQAGSQPLNLDIAGFSGSHPITLDLTTASGTSFNLADAGSNLALTGGGALTTTGTGYRTGISGGTNVTLNHAGGMNLGQVDVGNFNLTAAGAVTTSGGANRLTALNANVTANGPINLNTAVSNLTVRSNAASAGIGINELDGLNLLDVTVNDGFLNAAGPVATWIALFGGGPRALAGNLNLGSGVVDFRLRDTSNSDILLAGITGNLVTVTSGSSNSTGGNILQQGAFQNSATILSLTTGGVGRTIGTSAAPILFSGGGQITTRQNNGEIHVRGASGSNLDLSSTGVLSSTGTIGADFSGWSIEEFSNRPITFGPGGIGFVGPFTFSPLTTFQLISAGDILSDAGIQPDIFAQFVTLRGANIGTAANNILVALQPGGVLDAFGSSSTFVTIVDNLGGLSELANWVVNTGGSSQITALNGVVNVTGNNVATTTPITTSFLTNAVNVSVQGSTATLGNGATPFTVSDTNGPADSRITVNATTINGGVAGNDLVTTNTNVRLTSGTGGINLQTNTMGGNLTLEALGTGAGAINVQEATSLSARDLTVRTTGASTATVTLAGGGFVNVGATVSADTNGLIRNLHLENLNGSYTVDSIAAGGGNVTLFATGNVVDGFDAGTDVTASNLYVQSGGLVFLDVALTGSFAGNITGSLSLDSPSNLSFDGSAIFPGATNFDGAALPGGTFVGGNALVNTTGTFTTGFLQAGPVASITAASIIDGIDNPTSGSPALNCPDIVADQIVLASSGTIGVVGAAGTLEVDALDLLIFANGGTALVNDCNTLNSLGVGSSGQAWRVGTNNGAQTIGVDGAGLMSTTGGTPVISNFTLVDNRPGAITLGNVDMTGANVSIGVGLGSIADDNDQTTRICAATLDLFAAGPIGGAGNLDIDTCVTGRLATNVTTAGAPTFWSQRDAGGVLTAGPGNYTAGTNNGPITGRWAGSTLDLNAAGGLNITSTGTGVSLTRTGDIVLGTANVSNTQNLELISRTGAILDDAFDGGSAQPDATVDIIAANGRLRGTSIGTAANPIEYTIANTVDAQSSTSGVFLASTTRTEHLIINTPGQDYQVSFLGADSGAAANVSFLSGQLTQTGNAGGTDISLTNRGGGSFNDVTIASAVNNSVAGGQAEFIDIQVLGGSIFRTGPATNRIISDNVSFGSSTGAIGTLANPILTTTTNLCASTPTAGQSIFIDEADQLQNLLVYYNKPTGNATTEVAVNWLDAANNPNSLTVAPATGALNGRGNDTNVYLTNGLMDPSITAAGGDILVGRYSSGTTGPGNTTSLALRSRGGGSILDQATDGFNDTLALTNFDMGGANSLSLTAERGSIGSLANPIEVSNSVISAYTPFSGVGSGTIALHGVGALNTDMITFQQVYAGGGALSGVPVCAANVFVPPTQTQVAGLSGNGNVQISSNATIKAVDVQAGTSGDDVDGNVQLISRNGGDIQVESVKAIGDRIRVNTLAGGNVLDCTPATRDANFAARDLRIIMVGTGSFGAPPAKPTLNGIIDVSVENVEGDIGDGGLYLHALSAVTLGSSALLVNDNTAGTPEPVLVIAEGTTTIGFLGATVNGSVISPIGARVHVETRNGTDLLVDTVNAGTNGFVGLFAGLDSAQLASGNLVARTTATLEDINFTATNIFAGNVSLVAGAGIGEFNAAGTANVNFLEIDARSLAGLTTTGSIRVNNVSTGTTTVDCITDAVCMAPYNICGLTAGQDVILRSQGDVIINPAVNAATTPVTAGRLVCIESQDGSILDNNAVSALDISAPNIGLIAGPNNAAAPVTTIGTPTDFLEIDANILAGRAIGSINIADPNGYTVGDLNPVGCPISGLTSLTAAVCLFNTTGSVVVNTNITAATDIAIFALTDIDLQAQVSTSGPGSTVSLRAGRDILDNRAGAGADVTGDNIVVLAGRNAGGAGNPIEIDANTFAGQAGTASGNILSVVDLGGNVAGAASPNLTLGTLTTLQCTTVDTPVIVRGAQADVVCLNANAGDLIIPGVGVAPVVGTTISLSAQNNVDLGQQITATNLAFVRAVNGLIIDNNGANNVDVSANQVALRQGSATTDLILTVAANTLAAFSGRGIQISDADGFTVGTVLDPCTGVTTTGVSATGDICLAATGLTGGITVTESVTSTAGNVALGAAGDIAFSGNGRVVAQGATNRVSLVAGGNIVDNRNAVTSEVSAANVVLSAQNIGAPAGSDGALEIDAATVAARATSPTGTVRLNDLSGNLVIGQLDTLNCGPNSPVTTVTGVTSQTVTCVNAVGNIDVQQPVTGNTISLRAGGNINLAQTVTASGANSFVGLDAAGTIIDGNGAANTDVTANNVLLAARGATGDVILTIEADTAAAVAGRDINISDPTGLTIGSLTDPCFATTVTGATATRDVCVAALGGDLIVDEDMTGRDVGLFARDNVNLRDAGAVTDGQVRATRKASLVASTGAILDNRGTTTPEPDVTGGQVVLSAGTNIGAAGNALEVRGGQLAARANNGIVNLEQIGQDVTITAINTLNCGAPAVAINGVSATGDVCLASRANVLNINRDVRSETGNVAVAAGGSGSLFFITGATGQVRADQAGRTASISVGGAIIDDGRPQGTVDVQATNVVMRAGNSIQERNGLALGIDADNLAVRSGNNINLNDVSNGFVVTTLNTIACGPQGAVQTDGVFGQNTVCLAATNTGDIIVDEEVRSSNGSLALFAQGNINLRDGGANTDGQVRTNTRASLVANTGAIIDGRTGTAAADVQARDIVLRSATDIGTATNPLEIDATNMAARANNGVANLNDVAGGVTVTSLVLDTCGGVPVNTRIDGVSATGDVCLAATGAGNSLSVVEDVRSSGGNVAIFADTNLDLNGPGVNTAGQIRSDLANGTASVVTQNGAINDNRVGVAPDVADVQASNVVLRAGTSIGGASNPLELDATNLAAFAGGGGANLADVAGGVTVTSLTASDCGGFNNTAPIVGVSATGDVCVAATGVGSALNIVQDVVSSNASVALFATQDINLNGAAPAGQIRANTQVSLVSSSGSLVDNRDNLAGSADIQARDLVIFVANNIGSATNAVEIDVTNLAARATGVAGGTINLNDLSGGVTVSALTTSDCGGFTPTNVQGLTGSLDVCLASSGGGSINVIESVSGTNSVSLYADQDVNFLGVNAGGVLSSNGTASVVARDGSIVDNRIGTVGAPDDIRAASAVLVAGNAIGGASNPLEVSVVNLAARAGAGGANIADFGGGVTVTTLTTSDCGGFPATPVVGVSATGDVCVAALNGGSLDLQQDVSGANAAVFAAQDLLFNGTATTGRVNATGKASLVALGVILDNRDVDGSADVVGRDIVILSGAAIGSGTNALEIDGTNLAARATTGVVNLNDVSGGVTVTSLTTTACGPVPATQLDGVTSTGDVCVAATGGGSLTILQDVSSNANTSVYASQDVNFNGTAPAGLVRASNSLRASVVAENGSIIDNRDNLAGSPDVQGLNVVLVAGNAIGGASNPLEIDAINLAARAGLGGINLDDVGGGVNTGLIGVSNCGGFVAPAINGVQATGDVCVAATGGGSLGLIRDIASSGGNAAVYADQFISFLGPAPNGQLRAANTASAVAGGGILDFRDTPPSSADIVATNVVLRAGTSIGAAGNPLEIDAINLAARADNGVVNLNDLSAGVTVTSLSTIACGTFPATRIDGVTASGDVCLAASNSGDLTVREDVSSDTGLVALYALNNINLENGTNTAAQVRSTTTASLVADNGAINDNRTTLTPEADVQAANVVLRAGTSIGAAGNPLELDATVLAARANNGAANLDDVAGGVTVGSLTTVACGAFPATPIVGVSATGDVCVAATNSGDLDIQQDIVSTGANVAVYAFNDVLFNGVAPAGQIRAADTASVVAHNGSIVDNRGGATPDIVSQSLGIFTNGNVGTPAQPLELDVVNLAIRANNGGIAFTDTANGVTVTSISTLGCGDLPAGRIDGVTATNDVCLAAINGGSITIREDVASDTGTTAVYAADSVNFENGINTAAQVRSTTTVSVVADTGALVDNRTTAGANEADALATNVVLRAGTSIGGANNPLEINATNLAAAALNGGANIDDVGGGVTVTTLSTLACGPFAATPIVGVQSTNGDVCVAATNGGSVSILQNIVSQTFGFNVAVYGDQDVRFESPTAAGRVFSNGGTTSVVAANGAIVDNRDAVGSGNDILGRNVVLSAGTSIGAATNPLEIDSLSLAARANNGVANIEDIALGAAVTSVTTLACGDLPVTRIDGVTATGDVCLAATNSGNLVIREEVRSSGGNVAVYAVGGVALFNGANTASQIRSDAANGTASVVADNGAIVDGRVTQTPEADVQAANVVLRAGTNIGSVGNPLEIDATNLAARAANGTANIDDVAGGVTVTSLSTIGCGSFPVTRIDGVTATGDVCVAATNSGSLTIREDVASDAGVAALYGFADVNFENGTNTAAQVRSTTTASVVAQNGAINDNRTTVGANEADVVTNDVVLRAANGIGAAGNPLEIQATNLAAAGGTGVANIDDIGGGVTVTSLTTVDCGDLPSTRIDGVSAFSDVCVAATNSGDLIVDEEIFSGAGNVGVYAFNNVNLRDAGPNTNGQIRSNGGAATVSVVAENGAIQDNRTSVAPEADVVGANVVLRAGTSVGAAGNPLEIDATNLAARAANGVANIDDVAGGVTVTSLSTLGCGDFSVTRIDGVTATGDVCVAATNSGDLTVREDVASDAGVVALYAFNNINLENGTNTAAQVRSTTTASLVAQNGAINDNRTTVGANEADVVANDVVLRAANGIGAAGNPLEVRATNLAAAGGTGVANIDDIGGGVTVTSLSTLACGAFPVTRIDGVSAFSDVCVAATNSGDLIVDEQIFSGAGNVGVYAFNNVNLRDAGPNTNGQILSNGGNAVASVVAENGAIQDNRTTVAPEADLQAANVVLRAGTSIGAAGNPLEIDATNLAARAANGVANIDDISGGVTVTSLSTLGCGDFPVTRIDGVSATGDVCVAATNNGSLTIREDVASATGVVGLYGFSDINLENGTNTAAQVRSTTTASLVAQNGAINDNRTTLAPEADVQAANVVLRAATSIGAAGNPLEIDATNLAARAANGVANIDDVTGGVTVTSLSTIGCGDFPVTRIDGVTATGDVCVAATNSGDLTIREDVASDAGVAAVYAFNNINLQNGTNTAAQVRSTTTASLVAQNSAINDNRTTLAPEADVQAANVVLRAGTSIGAAGNPLEIDATNLAARAANGGANIDDVSGGMTVTSLSTIGCGDFPVTRIDGVSATGDVCLAATNSGDLILDEEVRSSGGNVAVYAFGNLNLRDGGPNTDGQVRSDAANGTASLVTQNGDLLDNRTGTDRADVRASNIVIRSAQNVGVVGNPLEIDGTNLAARANNGTAIINDIAGGITITTLNTIACGDFPATAITGVSATGEVCVSATNSGDMTVLQDVVSETSDASLYAFNNINFNGTAPAGQVRAANVVSLVADYGAIVDNRAGNTADVQSTSLAMRANGDIGAAGNPLEIAVANLAGRSDTGMINVLDLNGGVTITTVSTSACGGVAPEALQGLRAATDVCVDAQGGDIILNQPVLAGRDAALRASNNIELNESVTAVRTASLEAGNGIHDNNDANAVDVKAANVVMLAQNEIGTMLNPIEYDTNVLAAQSVSNSIYLNGLGNTVTIGELTTLKGNLVVTGVKAGAEVCIDQLSSGIIVDKPVIAGTQVALQASGDILLNEFVQAANKASLLSVSGSIKDNNDAAVDVRAQDVVMAAQGSVGSEANSIDIEAVNLAVRATTGDVGINDTTGSLCVTTIGLLKAGGDVVGVTAGQSVFLQTNQDLLLGLVQAGTTAHLVSQHGSIVDKDGPAPNVIAGSGANLEACEGFIGSRGDALDVAITGDLRVDSHFSVLEGTVTGSIIVGPCADNPVFGGLFNGRPIGGKVVDNSALANDSVFLGENRAYYPFYQNLMFNYLDNVVDNPVVVRYVSDDYDFLKDLDFLLHKKADGEAIDINPSNPTGPDKLTRR